MNKAFLLIGGNIGDRRKFLESAGSFIDELAGKVVASSSIYQTAAWGIEDQAAFLNQVLLIETTLTPDELLTVLLKIEETLGRKRTVKFGPRTLDIDILLYNDYVINENYLKVPHPALPDRRFALIPLCELAADYIHPTYKKSIKQLLDECQDELPVQKYVV